VRGEFPKLKQLLTPKARHDAYWIHHDCKEILIRTRAGNNLERLTGDDMLVPNIDYERVMAGRRNPGN